MTGVGLSGIYDQPLLIRALFPHREEAHSCLPASTKSEEIPDEVPRTVEAVELDHVVDPDPSKVPPGRS